MVFTSGSGSGSDSQEPIEVDVSFKSTLSNSFYTLGTNSRSILQDSNTETDSVYGGSYAQSRLFPFC